MITIISPPVVKSTIIEEIKQSPQPVTQARFGVKIKSTLIPVDSSSIETKTKTKLKEHRKKKEDSIINRNNQNNNNTIDSFFEFEDNSDVDQIESNNTNNNTDTTITTVDNFDFGSESDHELNEIKIDSRDRKKKVVSSEEEETEGNKLDLDVDLETDFNDNYDDDIPSPPTNDTSSSTNTTTAKNIYQNIKKLYVHSQLLNQYSSSSEDHVELQHCLGNCIKIDCCLEKCCSGKDKQDNIKTRESEEAQYQSLREKDPSIRESVYHLLKEGTISGIKKPKYERNYVKKSDARSHEITLKSPFELVSDGVVIKISPSEAECLYAMQDSNNTSDYKITSLALIERIHLLQLDLSHFIEGVDWLLTIQTDSPRHIVLANQQTYYFNGDQSTQTKYDGTIVTSGKSTTTNSNRSCLFVKEYRDCVLKLVLDWWNLPTPKLISPPDKRKHKLKLKKEFIIQLEDLDHHGHADSLLSFWICKFYFPEKYIQCLQNLEHKNKAMYDKLVQNHTMPKEYTKLFVPYKDSDDTINYGLEDDSTLHDFTNYESDDDGNYHPSKHSATRSRSGFPNTIVLNKKDVLETWKKSQIIIDKMNPFIDLSKGFYVHLKPLNRSMNTIQSQFSFLSRKNDYTLKFSITLSNILRHVSKLT